MGKNSNNNSTKEILETTVKVAGTVTSVGAAILNVIGDNKK